MIDFHLVLLIFVYSIFFVILLSNTVKHIKKNHSITIMTLCRSMYVVAFVIIPIMTYSVYLKGFITSTLYYDDYMWTHYIISMCAVVAYYSMEFGYKIRQQKLGKKYRLVKKSFIMLITILMLISIISLFLWASGFGGVKELINNANSIRAGFVTSSNNKAFFKHFVPMSMIVSFIAFKCLFVDKIKIHIIKKIYVFFLFIVSITVSVLFILSNDGRMLAGVYIILFFLLVIKNEYEAKNKSLKYIFFKTLILSILTIILIINADNIFRLIKGKSIVVASSVGEKSNIFSTLASEFSFTLTGTQQAIILNIIGDGKLTILNDMINGIFAWLPSALKPCILQDVWDYNTALLNTGIYGQLPTSILAQSIYDLGIIGVFFIPFLYGLVIKKIERVLGAYDGDIFFNTIYIVLGFYLAKGIMYFSIYNIMMNIFFIVAACIIYKILKKYKRGLV